MPLGIIIRIATTYTGQLYFNLYYKSKSQFFVTQQIHTVQGIVAKFFTVIPESLLKGLVPFLLLKNN